MKRYIVLVSTVLMLGGLASCNKDFLDRSPQTEVPPEQFFNNETDLGLYINGLLALPGRNNFVADQNTDDKATTGSQEIKNMMYGSPSSQTITEGWDWERLRNINYFLQNYQKADVTQEVKDHYAGLARFYRAEFYMEKVKRYSDVPWYSTTLNPSDVDELYKPRDSRSLIIDSVMADLEFASTHVKEKVPAGTPGKWVVKLVYARHLLYEGTFRRYHPELGLQSGAATFISKAAAVAGEIMTSGKFRIFTESGPAADYASLFNSASLAANPEVMLVHVYDEALGHSGNNNSTVMDYEMSPSRDLIQEYLMKDGSRFTDQPGYKNFQFVKEFENRDPRLSQTIMAPGIILASTPSKPYIQRLNKNFTGYHQLKGYINTIDTKVSNDVDFPAYRFAEVLLIIAEAKAEDGTLTQGDLDLTVNQLRTRVGMPAMSLAAANASPDPVLSSKYPDVTGANKGVILEIRREKRVEFAAEGYRFDDLMRWHAGKLIEAIPEGMYFPGLGKFDLTGDGIEDIILIDKSATIPAAEDQEKNSLGENLVYYKAGTINDNVTVYLKNGNAGGTMVTDNRMRQFIEPKYYYRPVPFSQMTLNPHLAPQLFDWN
ncbi:MAG: RagB/SusD family nutrient uptake outer membrane protein [Chitinophagaceae bacterium]